MEGEAMRFGLDYIVGFTVGFDIRFDDELILIHLGFLLIMIAWGDEKPWEAV
jgi:hypothetical protein